MLKEDAIATPATPRRLIGLTGSAIWLIFAGGGFLILSRWLSGAAAAVLILLVCVVTAVLLGSGVKVLREVLRLTRPLPPRTPEEKVVWRRFVRVGIAEFAAFIVVNGICAATGHVDLIAALDAAIVGIHFLPLARIFRVRRYYPLGILFCLAAGVTLLLPPGVQIGHAAARYVIPSLGCAPAACVVGLLNLREAIATVRK